MAHFYFPRGFGKLISETLQIDVFNVKTRPAIADLCMIVTKIGIQISMCQHVNFYVVLKI